MLLLELLIQAHQYIFLFLAHVCKDSNKSTALFMRLSAEWQSLISMLQHPEHIQEGTEHTYIWLFAHH